MLSIKSFARIFQPEYLFRPQQIGRRLRREFTSRPREIDVVRLPWGLEIAVHPGESIANGLLTLGMHDTVVTEALWRLARPGDVAVDGGANVGYMTSLLAARVGARGRIYCFEPHPEVFALFQRNVKSWQSGKQCGSFFLFQAALGDRDGVAALVIPEYFSANWGTSWIEAPDDQKHRHHLQVKVMALDGIIGKQETIGVLKLDVQGSELAVFRGMENILAERRARNIIFEETEAFPAATHRFLRDKGYSLFGLDRRYRGIRCIPEGPPRYDPVSDPSPNYLATIEPRRAASCLQRGFWTSFGPARLLHVS